MKIKIGNPNENEEDLYFYCEKSASGNTVNFRVNYDRKDQIIATLFMEGDCSQLVIPRIFSKDICRKIGAPDDGSQNVVIAFGDKGGRFKSLDLGDVKALIVAARKISSLYAEKIGLNADLADLDNALEIFSEYVPDEIQNIAIDSTDSEGDVASLISSNIARISFADCLAGLDAQMTVGNLYDCLVTKEVELREKEKEAVMNFQRMLKGSQC